MPSSATPPADSLLQHREFVAFWFARIASGFGFQMLSVAVGWQIYAITGRAFDLGLIGLVQFVPSLLLALPAGHAADQFERRRIVLHAGQGGLAAARGAGDVGTRCWRSGYGWPCSPACAGASSCTCRY